MELVYISLLESSNDMLKMMDEEFWKRLGPTVLECKAMGRAAKELKGEEGEKLMKAFQDEAEAAEAGMGAMFG